MLDQREHKGITTILDEGNMKTYIHDERSSNDLGMHS